MEWSTDKIKAWEADPKQFERDLKLEVIFGNEDNEIFAVPTINGYRSDIVFNYTLNEMEEFIELTKDPLNIDKYQPNKLRDYQKEMLSDISKNKFCVLNVSRQIGTNMVAAHYALHLCLTNYDKALLFHCENEDTCEKFFKCVLDLLFKLPYHLQVGVRNISFKDGILNLSNGSRLIIRSDVNSIGFGVDYLILPDFAFNNQAKQVVTGLLPTIFYKKFSRALIYSCPNKKDDEFSKIFNNEEKHYFKKVYPYTIMNLPNSKLFEEAQIAMIGEDCFIKEYECIFPGTAEFRDRKLGILFN